MATPSKRRRNDELPTIDSAEDLQDKLRLAIRTHESAEVALLYLIREYKFDSVMFQQALKGMLIVLDLRDRLDSFYRRRFEC
jgi:hypothetical protein